MADEIKKDSVLDSILAKSLDDIIPWEDCELPSRGFYYGSAIPGGKILVRGMGLNAEKVMSTQRLAQSGQSISWLFNKCVKFPTKFDSEDLLVGDRAFLLYYLRGITHGSNYEFVLRCTNEDCGADSIQTYDLADLYKTIKYPETELGLEPFKVKLPYISKVMAQDVIAGVRFMRGRDLLNMITNRKQIKRGGFKKQNEDNIDDTIEKNLNMVIIDINGEANQYKIAKFVEKIHSTDSSTIRQFIIDHQPGIKTDIEVRCPDCSALIAASLPITESFFRSTVPRTNGS